MSLIQYYLCSYFQSLQIPGADILDTSDYEEANSHKLSSIPAAIELFGKQFALVGVLIFKPPFTEDDCGHYECAIRINNQWDIHSDLEKGPRKASAIDEVVMHTVFFVAAK